MSYNITEVKSGSDIQDFLLVPHILYAKDKNWVAPLESEIKDTFIPAKNTQFEKGDACRWVIRDDKGHLAGRIAAFYDKDYAARYEVPVGGVGFFECVNDKEASRLLFDTAKKWLEGNGMEAMDGPINFGGNDRYWGLLVEGFTHPSFQMNYNHSYYKELFESYGFVKLFEQVSRHLDLTQPMPERFRKIAEWISKKPGIRFDHARKGNLLKYGMDFMEVYNDAWRFHDHFVEMTESQVKKMIKKIKPIVIEKFMIFAYVNDEPAGILFAFPDLNQIFRNNKGKLGIIDKLKFAWRSRNNFAWYRKKKILTRGRVVVIGVRPKFQKYGLETGLTMFSMQDGKDMGFEEIELSWVGEFNPMSRKLQDATGASPGKIHQTFRVMFDPNKEVASYEKLTADPRAVSEGKEEPA